MGVALGPPKPWLGAAPGLSRGCLEDGWTEPVSVAQPRRRSGQVPVFGQLQRSKAPICSWGGFSIERTLSCGSTFHARLGFDATRSQPSGGAVEISVEEIGPRGIIARSCPRAAVPLAVAGRSRAVPAQFERKARCRVSSRRFLPWALWQVLQLAALRPPSKKRSSSSNPHRSPTIRCRPSIAEVSRTGRAVVPARTTAAAGWPA